MEKRGLQPFKLGYQYGQFFTKNKVLFDDTSNIEARTSETQN